MTKRLLFALLALYLVTNDSFASQLVLVAQGRFTRSTGSPVREAAALLAWDGPAHLKLYNGGTSGIGPRVSSAHVWLNGELVVGPSSFKQNVHIVQVDVQARFNSTLELKIASAPDSYLDYEFYMQIPDEVSVLPEAEFRQMDAEQGDGDTLAWLSELGFTLQEAVLHDGSSPRIFASFTNQQQRLVLYVLDEQWPFGLSPVVVFHDDSGLLFVKRRGGVLLSDAFSVSVLSEAEVAIHVNALNASTSGVTEDGPAAEQSAQVAGLTPLNVVLAAMSR